MIFDYSQETFKEWATINSINFSRKLQNETAFDGIIKIYSVITNNLKINKLIHGLYFGDLIHVTTNGLLLRQFKNKNSWPYTLLVHLNTNKFKLTTIMETDSSYQCWEIKEIARGKYNINLTPTESIEFIDI